MAEPTRRVMLAAAAAGSLGLAGCKGIAALGPLPNISPDVVTLEHAIEAEELMVATYRAAAGQLAASGNGQRLSAVVTAIQAEHQAHVTRLRARLVLPPRLARTKFAAGRPSPLPADSHGIIGALVADERAAAARLTSQLLHAPPALAQLMASIAASEAAHVIYLRRAGAA
ncbi:MAG TPA: ferritin-like domain-containing protein [Streptosporangiaceae bacterium]|nr:ferritin-like domain-containing protein [Streptosporangiaceae bacterium]